MRNLGRTTLLALFSREISSGEQRENATVWRFLEAKSSPQGVEGEGYAPTRNDYVAGQGTCPPPSLGSGSTHKTPHSGVLIAQDDTRVSKEKTPRCGVFSKRSPRHKEFPKQSTIATQNDYVAGQGVSKEKTPRCGVLSRFLFGAARRTRLYLARSQIPPSSSRACITARRSGFLVRSRSSSKKYAVVPSVKGGK